MPLESQAGLNRGSVIGFDYVEIYVGNSEHSTQYLRTCFGFHTLRRSGIQTSLDANSSLLAHGGVRLIVTSALRRGPISEYVSHHGDSVKDIALHVQSVDSTFERAIQNGARAIIKPRLIETGECADRIATVGTPGGIVHSLVQHCGESSESLPNADTRVSSGSELAVGLSGIDHIALAVGPGQLHLWVEYYRNAFGFEVTHEETTATAFSGMRSIVVENESRSVKFPIMEPIEGRRRSQIEDFLFFHGGPGVQHIALLCDDIVQVVTDLRGRGVEFITVPDDYYELLASRSGDLGKRFGSLQDMRLLYDRDEWGELIQTFSKPFSGRPTLFFELVQRNGARGFGGNNIRALFEAKEREQGAQ